MCHEFSLKSFFSNRFLKLTFYITLVPENYLISNKYLKVKILQYFRPYESYLI